MKSKIKMLVDVVMTVLFLLLMAYHVTSSKQHEWLGVSLFVLFIVHHLLNWNWHKALLKGKYTPARAFMLVMNVLLFAAMIGMIVSGILISNEVFDFLHLRSGMFGRRLHMISTSWGYVLMSAHLGLHWGQVVTAVGKRFGGSKPSPLPRIAAILLSVYGVYAFYSRRIWEYMFALVHFAFFDYEEPVILFFADYLAVMGLFACIAYYIMKGLGNTSAKTQGQHKAP